MERRLKLRRLLQPAATPAPEDTKPLEQKNPEGYDAFYQELVEEALRRPVAATLLGRGRDAVVRANVRIGIDRAREPSTSSVAVHYDGTLQRIRDIPANSEPDYSAQATAGSLSSIANETRAAMQRRLQDALASGRIDYSEPWLDVPGYVEFARWLNYQHNDAHVSSRLFEQESPTSLSVAFDAIEVRYAVEHTYVRYMWRREALVCARLGGGNIETNVVTLRATGRVSAQIYAPTAIR